MKIPFFSNENKNFNSEVVKINVDNIMPNPYQPRLDFSEQSLRELADSIASYGVIQPLTVRPVKGDKQYELIAGERRLRAAKLLNYSEVPAIIRDLDNQEMAEIALIENLQRKDLSFLEEAEAYKKLLEEFSLTQTDLAARIGKAQSTIANKLRILSLPVQVLKVVQYGGLNERQARALLQLDNKDIILNVVGKIVKKDLNVRETENLIKDINDPAEGKKNSKQKITGAFADVRLYANTLEKTLQQIDQAGAKMKVERSETEKEIEYVIKISRQSNG